LIQDTISRLCPCLQNLVYYEYPPPQGLSEARRDREVVRELSVTEPPRGRPIGGGGVHHNGNIDSDSRFHFMNDISIFSWIH